MSNHCPHILSAERTLAKFSDCANYCAISGNYVAATSNRSICTFNLLKNEIQVVGENKSATHQCTISSNGRVVATVSLTGVVQICNTKSPDKVWKKLSLNGYTRALGVALSRDGTTLAASFQKQKMKAGAVVVWDLCHEGIVPNFREIASWEASMDVFKAAMAISDDGTIVAHCTRGRVCVVRIQKSIAPFKCWKVIGDSHVAMAGDASTVVVADDRYLRVFRTTSDNTVKLPGYACSFRPFCDVSMDGGRVIAAVSGNKFRVWNVHTRTVVADIVGFGRHARGCAIHPDGNKVVMCSFDHTVRMVDLAAEIADAEKKEGVSEGFALPDVMPEIGDRNVGTMTVPRDGSVLFENLIALMNRNVAKKVKETREILERAGYELCGR